MNSRLTTSALLAILILAGYALDGRAAADLALTKLVDNARPAANTGVEFTVTLANNGPDATSGIEIQDALPEGLIITSGMSAFASQGDYDPDTGLWQAGALAANATATLVLPAMAADAQTPGCYANHASVVASSEPDPLTENNQSDAVVLTNNAQECAHLVVAVTPDIVMGTGCKGGFSPGRADR